MYVKFIVDGVCSCRILFIMAQYFCGPREKSVFSLQINALHTLHVNGLYFDALNISEVSECRCVHLTEFYRHHNL